MDLRRRERRSTREARSANRPVGDGPRRHREQVAAGPRGQPRRRGRLRRDLLVSDAAELARGHQRDGAHVVLHGHALELLAREAEPARQQAVHRGPQHEREHQRHQQLQQREPSPGLHGAPQSTAVTTVSSDHPAVGSGAEHDLGAAHRAGGIANAPFLGQPGRRDTPVGPFGATASRDGARRDAVEPAHPRQRGRRGDGSMPTSTDHAGRVGPRSRQGEKPDRQHHDRHQDLGDGESSMTRAHADAPPPKGSSLRPLLGAQRIDMGRTGAWYRRA